MAQEPLFNVRVYGILIDSRKRVLVADEFIRGEYFTKFPGGGLEFGEGTRDCVKREFREETGLDVVVGEHLYTTDFFQLSAFNKRDQIISIYYYIHVQEPFALVTHDIPFDFAPQQVADKAATAEVFRWIHLDDLEEGSVSLPIDKVAVGVLKSQSPIRQ